MMHCLHIGWTVGRIAESIADLPDALVQCLVPVEKRIRPEDVTQLIARCQAPSPANERSGAFSPDGRWLAYTSNRSRRDEVYVRRFEPRGEQDILISADGGREARWAPDGREIFYRAGNALLAVSISYKQDFEAGAPSILFEGHWATDPGGLNQMYDVSPDGERFLMIENAEDLRQINIVVGWSPGRD